MDFSEGIKIKANEFFDIFREGEMFRGKSRKAIIFACFYSTFLEENKYQTPEKLRNNFEINNKQYLKGIKIVGIKLKYILKNENSTNYYLQDNSENCSIDEEEIINLYNKIKDRSSLFFR